jgi:hypothetical protein
MKALNTYPLQKLAKSFFDFFYVNQMRYRETY